MKSDLKDLDVLHLGYRLDRGYSISKIINNLISNATRTTQNKISLKRFENEKDTIDLINRYQPKILHLHFSSLWNEELFGLLNYRPYIICTVHGLVENPYRKYVDLLICIHDGVYKMNTGERIVIENTVDINKNNIVKKVFDDVDFCCSCRYAREAINDKTIRTFGSVYGKFYIYGYNRDEKRSRQFYRTIKKYNNLIPEEWSDNIESCISKHAVYAYIKPIINPNICQGMNVMEATNLGIPCITTKKLQNYQKYVIDNFNGFMVEDSINFIKKCNFLSKNHYEFKRIKENAIEHSKNLKNTMPQQYEEIYLKVLGK